MSVKCRKATEKSSTLNGHRYNLVAGPGQKAILLSLADYRYNIVGWEIYDHESSKNSSELICKTHLREQVGLKPLVLHSANGSPMKGESLFETLHDLGIDNSYSRPQVRNDNAFTESIFRTCKYHPNYP